MFKDGLTKKIKTHVEQSSYHLIETLAETIASLVLEDKRIQKVSVLLYKPQALSVAKRVGIKLLRENQKKTSKIPHVRVHVHSKSDPERIQCTFATFIKSPTYVDFSARLSSNFITPNFPFKP